MVCSTFVIVSAIPFCVGLDLLTGTGGRFIDTEDPLELIEHKGKDTSRHAEGWTEDNSQVSHGHLVHRRILYNTDEMCAQSSQEAVVLER